MKATATLSHSEKLWALNPMHLRKWHRLVYPDGAAYVPAWEQYRGRYHFDVMPTPQTIDLRTSKLRTPPLDSRHPCLPESYILPHPASAWLSKSWPVERWSYVLSELHAAGFGPFVLTGGFAEWERAYAKEVCDQSTAPILNLGGQTTLQQYLHTSRMRGWSYALTDSLRIWRLLLVSPRLRYLKILRIVCGI